VESLPVNRWFEYKKAANQAIKEHGLEEGEYLISVEHTIEPVENAISNLKNAINGVLGRFNGATYEGYLSDGPGFRAAVATTRVYKGNRDPDAKPAHYADLRRYCVSKLGGVVVSEIEADDMVGIKLNQGVGKHCAISNDKDLKQIVGWHYNWTKPDEKPTWIGPKDAILKFYEQLISGDPTDNVVGIPGIGPVGAVEHLANVETPGDAERRAWELYKEHYPRPDNDSGLQFVRDRFLENARLVYILRKEEEIGKLWEPRIELN